jgi:hypothetical protein
MAVMSTDASTVVAILLAHTQECPPLADDADVI